MESGLLILPFFTSKRLLCFILRSKVRSITLLRFGVLWRICYLPLQPKDLGQYSIFYPSYIPFNFPFYLFSLLSLLPHSLVGEIFPCKGTASFRSSSTATLTGSRIERQPSQIEDDLSVPSVLHPSGWVFR